MPVTARLSKQFYDRLGDQVASELVEWFNQVDSTYRADLRELNEMNFVRFDAKLEQRLGEQSARIDARFAEQDARIDARFAEMDARIDARFAEQDARIDRRFAEFEVKMEKRFAEFEIRIERRIAEFEAKIERRFAEQSRFLYLALATQMALIVGLYFR